MKTRLLVSLLGIIPLAGTLVHSVPPPRTFVLPMAGQKIARANQLTARIKQSGKLFRTGDFLTAAALAQQGYRDALSAGEPQIAARFLGNLGGCRFALHQYREALQAYVEARRLAEAAHDTATAGKLDFNIASLYIQLGQTDAAAEALSRAVTNLSGPANRGQVPKLLISLAALQADQGRMPKALDLYRQAITAAGRAGDLEISAEAWNDLGYEYLEHGQLPHAEHALLEAYRVRKLNHLRTVESSYRNVGMLRLAQGDLSAAAILLDRAVLLSAQRGGLRPDWEVYYARGRVRLAQNRLPDALADIRIAARLAGYWRRNTFPDDATRVSTENTVERVQSALVEAGNRLYFATRRPELAAETFDAGEANRAASMRALLAEPRDWCRKLPAEYWATLGKLETAETDLLRSGNASTADAAGEQVRQLQGALIEWESRAGSDGAADLPDLLKATRRSLRPDSAFFAFHLAPRNSYLWAVSRDSFALYRLPPGPVISALAERFVRAVRHGSTEAGESGSRLFTMLFGQLSPAFQEKPRWLLAPDAQLFELPFAALIEERRGPVFLAERHSLQITSGAALLSAGRPRAFFDGRFVGVADPVYNMADPRWQGSRPGRQPAAWMNLFAAGGSEAGGGDSWQLARLPGSAREVADCAAAWNGPVPPVFLEGVSASRQGLRAALDRHAAVLHIATHVMHSSQASESGLIVLGLDRDGHYEVVGPAEIATWNLDGALVSLSGCSSGAADALPATGLMGLTRACQAAGARAVVASRWPAQDDSGAFFLSFYRYLRAAPQAGPAVALQHAQVDMLKSRSWRSNPLYWGAYFVTDNQQ